MKLAAVVEGDLVLGGLMMVHERHDRISCGPIMPQGGIQALEAMLYTLDRINADQTILPGIKLGAHILDDCDKDTHGLEMAVDFIKDQQDLLGTNDVNGVHSENHTHGGGAAGGGLHWPVKKEAVVEGDLVLGGLMMVHEREDSVVCGPIMPQGGVQALEAMLYTLDVINGDPDLLPGITLGAHILDDCDKDTYGLEMAVDFIKGSISNIDDAEYQCNKTVRKVISGVVGAASSVTSIQVANLLRLFRIPQVSFFSTSPELSNKQRFEFFSRTIPSDHYQVKAMVEMVQKFHWSYVSIIYEESNYGIKAFEELEDLLKERNVCIAVKEKLVKDSGVAGDKAYDEIVQKLLTKSRARGCIIFGSDQEVAGVMRAVRRAGASDTFSWIGSDGWSARALVSDGNEREVEGTLSVQPQAHPVKGFEEYFLNLSPDNNKRNPWFVEFWEDHFHCRFPNSSLTPYNGHYNRSCSAKEKLTRENTVFENQLQFVSDAVMAFAHALNEMHKQLCSGRGLCDAMKPIDGSRLLRSLRRVNFTGLSGDQFKFDSQGDGPARYNIIHFKQVAPKVYRWVPVGEYSEGNLRLDMSAVQFKMESPPVPESVCSLPCDQGQAKKYVEGDICCWHCFNCTQYQIRAPLDETLCQMCQMGTVPDANKTHCQEIPEVFLRPDSGWAIGAMSFSSCGILLTLFVGGVFLRHHETPVVRAAGRELSYVLLTGIMLCYCVTFALVLRPTNVVCGVQRFGAGFCFTVVYAALLTKTNRIARIFKAGTRTAKRPSFISPKSQLLICFFLVTVQVLVNVVWIMVKPPMAMHHHPTREDNHLVCKSHIDASYMIAFGYPILLIVVCTIYAVLTRKIPEAFSESKYIGFTMYTTCVIWLAFVPLYFGTGNHVPLRITSMSVTISLSASVTLACLFSPKLYIILIHPERNVRQSMMPAMRYSTVKSSAATVTGNHASNSLHPGVHPSTYLNTITALDRHHCPRVDCGTQSQGLPLEDRSTQTSLQSLCPLRGSEAANTAPCSADAPFPYPYQNGEAVAVSLPDGATPASAPPLRRGSGSPRDPGGGPILGPVNGDVPRSASPFSRTRSYNSALLKSRRRTSGPAPWQQPSNGTPRHRSDILPALATLTPACTCVSACACVSACGATPRSPCASSFPSSVASSPTSSALALDDVDADAPLSGRPSSLEAVAGSPGTPGDTPVGTPVGTPTSLTSAPSTRGSRGSGASFSSCKEEASWLFLIGLTMALKMSTQLAFEYV
ncbi:metabotropic glutamate receptor 2-like [Thrips palmi]|uniref:Metabotropic glutamate receptor 2-like n=1 Tax=Thrips palmi TaxID=161013 RepID=A0A6P8ZSR3_THRPL|nr:metabotropic glutamate receptor 2-like [Thrips palmi]